MTIRKTVENGTVTLAPEGWLDTLASPSLTEAVEAVTEARSLVLDLDAVAYMASAGLRAVVAAHKKAKELDASFEVINVCADVMSIFRMTGIDKKLTVREK